MIPVPPARHLLRAKDLVDARYREPLDVPALARAARLSPAHFSREFPHVLGTVPTTPEDDMLKNLTNVQVWVHDQDEALAFYTEKLGMELREDVTMPELGNFRWLSVGLPGQDVSITLMAVPGAPVFDDET